MVWVQIIPTRETGKLESAISTWTLRLRFHPYTDPTISHWSHSMSCHLTIYQFHFHSANYLFAKVRNYIRPRLRNPPLALNFHDSTFHHSLVDFLSRLSPLPNNASTVKPSMEILDDTLHFQNSTDTVVTIVAIPRLICFPALLSR